MDKALKRIVPGPDRMTLWVLGAGLVSLALYRAMADLGDLRVHLESYLLLHAALFGCYAVLAAVLVRRTRARARRGNERPWAGSASILLAVFAVAFRITLLFVPASLPSDVPVAGLLGLGEIGFKIVFTLFDLAAACALAILLRRLGRPPALAALYAWNPLVVVEIASSGHGDPVGIFLLLLAAIFIAGERRVPAAASYGLAALVRLVPLALAPIFVRRFKTLHLLVIAGILVAGYMVFPAARRAPYEALTARIEHPEHNSVVAPLVRGAIETLAPVDLLAGAAAGVQSLLGDPEWARPLTRWAAPAPFSRVLLLGVLVAGMIVVSLDVLAIERELLLAIGLLIVLSPVVRPSLLLWVLPFAAVELSLPWILFTGLVPLSYLSLQSPDGQVPWKVLLIEWGAPAALGIALAAWKRWPPLRARDAAARA